MEFDFENSNNLDSLIGGGGGNINFDIDSLMGGGGQNIDWDSLMGGGGGQGIDFSGFDNLDITDLIGIDFGQVAGDYGDSLGAELSAALQNDGNASSIFSGDGGLDVEALLNEQQRNNLIFNDDTEPGSSGGTQGSYGPAGEGDLGSYEGSSYGGKGQKLVFDDDREPGSSGGSSGSTGVAGSGDLGSYKGSTYDDSGGTKTKIDDKGNVILPDGTKVTPGGTVISPGTKTGPGGGGKQAGKSDNNMLLMLLALMAMMNKGGGESKGTGAVIPSLSADRRQLPYGPASGSKARPGAGGVTYFSPTTYSPKAADGGLMSLAGGGVTEMAIGGDTKKALEDAYAAAQQSGNYGAVNDLVSKNQITAGDISNTWQGFDTSGLSGLGVNLYQPPAANVQDLPVIPNNNALNTSFLNPIDTEISNYYDKNKNLFESKDYNKIASDMFVNNFTPEALARVKGWDQKGVTDLYNQTYGAFDRATQENLVNQKYKNKLGLTDEQLGQRNFGALMDTRENRRASKPFTMGYRDYLEEMAATGRRDAPEGTQFRTQAVFDPGAFRGRGVIKLYDTATGQHLTNVDMGNQVQAFELLDKFGVDPASYRKALGASFETAGVPSWQKDDYDYLMGYKPRNVAAATDAYLTKPLKNLTVGDLKPKYEKDDNNRQTADSKMNVFYEIPMTKLLQSKGLSEKESYNILSQLRPVAGLVNFAEISRSKDPVKAVIGTLNRLQKAGLTNQTYALDPLNDVKRDASGKRIGGRLFPDSTRLSSVGFKGLASGGISSLGVAPQMSNLGGYSDGGRLLKGPGDGVSDSIPATIGGKQPARLAEGEFVVPARIVSELGNGSTNAGAQKLYAMMDRVQKARRKTKNVAADTKAHKYLPA
jgi:hypothetical protein